MKYMEYWDFLDFPDFRISLIFHIFLIFMVSQRSGRHLESFLEPVRFILTEYGPISSHVDPICLDFDPICLILNSKGEPGRYGYAWIFRIFDAKVASTRPGTHLKRCASKFCVGWWSGHLYSSHMDPIGEKHVPRPYTPHFCMYDWIW